MALLLSWSYWFSLQARELMPSVKLALVVAFALLVALGIVARVIAGKKSESMFWSEGGRRFSSMALWMGVLGLLLVWCTHELVYFFGARFWYLVWLIVFLIQAVRLVKFLIVDVPKRSTACAEKARIDKWLPKGK